MKPILVIDDRSNFPSVGEELTGHVEFHTRFHDRSAVDFSQYGTTFVHERNDAQGWAMESLDGENERMFVFSGDEDRVSKYAGVYRLPRSVFFGQFEAFLRRYVAEGDVRSAAGVFTVDGPATTEGFTGDQTTASLSGPDSPDKIVAFYVPDQAHRESTEDVQYFPIERKDRDTARSIDFSRTLAPLRKLDEPNLVRLEEKYLSRGDGLDLLLHLRLEAEHAFSRFPVEISLRRSVETWIRQHPRFMIVATDKVTVQHLGGSDSESSADHSSPLSVDAHRRILERLPISGEDLSGRHDLANEWGPIQLWNGLSKLHDSDGGMPDWVRRNYDHLRRRRYYKYLFALLTLREAQTESGSAPQATKAYPSQKYERWCQFLEDRSNPLRVLLVDDEIDKGWASALQCVFEEFPDAGSVEAPYCPSDIEEDFEAVLKEIATSEWDLLLADLRLTEADQRIPTRQADQLAGMRLIRSIKERHPDRPVVAVTASNKAWTAKSLSTAGADGYWVKENPRYGVEAEYTVENAADLLDTIRGAVQSHDDASPVWTLVKHVESLLEDRSAVRQWVPLTEHQKPEEVREHLRYIVRRIRRAYGYLVIDLTDHEETEFSFRRLDLAFLTIWSILNEVVGLHFKDPPYQGDDLHEEEGRLYFSFFDPSENQDRVYWIIEDGKIEEEPVDPPSDLESALRPRKSDEHPIWPGSDTHRVSWLLRRIGAHKFDRRFNELRKLRNHLEMEHGKATRVTHADLGDIRDMIQIWRRLLTG